MRLAWNYWVIAEVVRLSKDYFGRKDRIVFYPGIAWIESWRDEAKGVVLMG